MPVWFLLLWDGLAFNYACSLSDHLNTFLIDIRFLYFFTVLLLIWGNGQRSSYIICDLSKMLNISNATICVGSFLRTILDVLKKGFKIT